MNSTVTIVDYGLGNLHSVSKALAYLGADVTFASDEDGLMGAERVVLPGVGAFRDGMRGLEERGLRGALKAIVERRTPLLGICLGAQLLLDESDEFGITAGLGIIPGRVVRLPRELKRVPLVGWRRLQPAGNASWAETLLANTAPAEWFYFVHSFHCEPAASENLLAIVEDQQIRVTAAVARDQVWGLQFHPEKSGAAGLNILRHFLTLA